MYFRWAREPLWTSQTEGAPRRHVKAACVYISEREKNKTKLKKKIRREIWNIVLSCHHKHAHWYSRAESLRKLVRRGVFLSLWMLLCLATHISAGHAAIYLFIFYLKNLACHQAFTLTATLTLKPVVVEVSPPSANSKNDLEYSTW